MIKELFIDKKYEEFNSLKYISDKKRRKSISDVI